MDVMDVKQGRTGILCGMWCVVYVEGKRQGLGWKVEGAAPHHS